MRKRCRSCGLNDEEGLCCELGSTGPELTRIARIFTDICINLVCSHKQVVAFLQEQTEKTEFLPPFPLFPPVQIAPVVCETLR